MHDDADPGHPASAAPRKSALVIDRDPKTRLVARRILEFAGFEVSTAIGDGYLPRGDFALVVADLSEVSLAYLQRRYPQVRVLNVSDQDPAGVTKPFTASEFLAAVRRRLARPIKP